MYWQGDAQPAGAYQLWKFWCEWGRHQTCTHTLLFGPTWPNHQIVNTETMPWYFEHINVSLLGACASGMPCALIFGSFGERTLSQKHWLCFPSCPFLFLIFSFSVDFLPFSGLFFFSCLFRSSKTAFPWESQKGLVCISWTSCYMLCSNSNICNILKIKKFHGFSCLHFVPGVAMGHDDSLSCRHEWLARLT